MGILFKDASDYKTQAATAKRTATAIQKIIDGIELERRLNVGAPPPRLNEKEKEALLKAATILKRLGSERSTDAKTLKRQEQDAERRRADFARRARQYIATWPPLETLPEKLGFLAAIGELHSAEHYLSAGPLTPYPPSDIPADAWAYTLHMILDQQMRDIAANVAWKAESHKIPVEQYLDTIREKAEANVIDPRIIRIADAWAKKLERPTRAP